MSIVTISDIEMVTVPFSATPVFTTFGNLTTFKMVLTGNVTGSTLVCTQPAGTPISFIIAQDATGGRSFVWPTNVKGASDPKKAAASKGLTQTFIWDGVNARAASEGIFSA